MSDREKLVELLENNPYLDVLDGDFGKAADHMIAHGVTVKQMQKPILETDLGKFIDSPVWFEEFVRGVEGLPLLLDGIGIYYAEFIEFGETDRLDRRIDDYNYSWRCWATKPTDEERKEAKWLE